MEEIPIPKDLPDGRVFEWIIAWERGDIRPYKPYKTLDWRGWKVRGFYGWFDLGVSCLEALDGTAWQGYKEKN